MCSAAKAEHPHSGEDNREIERTNQRVQPGVRGSVLNAVFPGPAATRFLERFSLAASELEIDFTGWHKVAILCRDSAYLFPRYARDATLISRAIVAHELLAASPLVPDLLGSWIDSDIYPYRFAALARADGVRCPSLGPDVDPEFIVALMASLGAAIANYHNLSAGMVDFQDSRGRNPSRLTARNWARQSLERDNTAESVGWAQTHLAQWLGVPHETPAESKYVLSREAAHVWNYALRVLADIEPVMVHGDLHEGQLVLPDPGDARITCILDWDTAAVDNPIRDFNYGEWSIAFWTWRSSFLRFHHIMWEAYRAHRAVELPNSIFITLFYSLQHTLLSAYRDYKQRPLPADLVGSTQESVAMLAEITDRAASQIHRSPKSWHRHT